MRSAGFTLVELLVVIGMIAILAGILLPVLGKARESSQRKADLVTITNLGQAIGMYELAYQDFPPSTLDKIGIEGANPINNGIEVLVAVLSSTKKGSPFYEGFTDDKLCNTDDDKAKANLSLITGGFNKPELWELMDEFSNPFIYIHHRDYANPGAAAKVRGSDGIDVTIACTRTEKTGEWNGAGTFQLWGMGPNMINENGGGDDVSPWNK